MADLLGEVFSGLLNTGGLMGNAITNGLQISQQRELGQQQLAIRAAQVNALQMEQRRALEKEQRYQSDLQAYSSDPTPQALAGLMMRYPDQAEAIKKSYDVLDAPARESRMANLFSLFKAAEGGRADLASGQIDALVRAEKARGVDTTDAEELRTALQSDDEAVRTQALGQLKGFAQAHLAIADPKFADQIGLGKQENHFGQLGSGGIFDQRTGAVVREPDPDWQFDPNSGSWLQKPGKGGGPASSGGAADGNFDTFHSRFLAPIEGGYAASDGRSGAPVNFGVNQKANPDVDVKNLTPQQAKSILRERYWKASGADRLPAGLAEVHGDTAVNAGVGKARDLLRQSRGDVDRYLDLREQHYRRLGGKELPVWLDRNEKLRAYVSGGGARGEGNSPGVVQVLPPKGNDARRMTADEVRAEGLDPNKTYYRNSSGVPQLVEGQTGRSAELTETQSKATGYLSTAVASVNALNTVKGYNPSTVALALNDLSNKNPLKGNLSQVDRRVLNAQLAFSTAVLRLESGAVVSPEEAALKAQTLFPLPGDGPQVQADKKAQREAALKALRIAAGPGEARVAVAVGPGGAVRVGSPAEAMRLKPGTLYVRPDGKVMRR